jgi:hypothetical protein
MGGGADEGVLVARTRVAFVSATRSEARSTMARTRFRIAAASLRRALASFV